MPARKTFFRPWISAILPMGTRNMAAASRYELTTQPRVTPSAENSLPICGSATLSAALMNGVIKEVSVATTSTALFSSASIQAVP
jgi:hypothetical protein